MSTADCILDQIDTALRDYAVSDDAMRSAPDLPEKPRPVRGYSPRDILIRRLVDRHGLTAEQAQAAILAAERGQAGEHSDLAALEVQAVLDEFTTQLRAAFQPILQRVTAQLRQVKEAFGHVPEAVGCGDCGKPARRRDRPAWQSPYGPMRRRR